MHNLTNKSDIEQFIKIPEDGIGFKQVCIKKREISFERNGKNPSKNSFTISKKETAGFLLAHNIVILDRGAEHLSPSTKLYCERAIFSDVNPSEPITKLNLHGCNMLVMSDSNLNEDELTIVGNGSPLTIINRNSTLPKKLTFKGIPEITFKGKEEDFDRVTKIIVDKDTKIRGLHKEVDLGISLNDSHILLLQKASERQNTL